MPGKLELRSALLKEVELVQSIVSLKGSFDDVLSKLGRVERVSRGHADEDLALAVESGYAVLAAVDLGVLENDPARFGSGEYNALVWVWDLERDEQSGEIRSVVVSPSSSNATVPVVAGRFLSAWLPVGGWIAEVLP